MRRIVLIGVASVLPLMAHPADLSGRQLFEPS